MEDKDNIRLINWNARSLKNKKTELELLIRSFHPHILVVTETWLIKSQTLHIHGYNIYRRDRAEGRGGGVAILVSKDLVTSPLEINITNPEETYFLDVLGVELSTRVGILEIVGVYSPPGPEPDIDSWRELISPTKHLRLCITSGDFNAHSNAWGSNKSNLRGNRLSAAADLCNMVPLNDKDFTHLAPLNQANNNLDLVFINSSFVPNCTTEVIHDLFSSDHLPVLCNINIRPSMVEPSKHRINTKDVDWGKLKGELEVLTDVDLMGECHLSPEVKYNNLINVITSTLMKCGARIPKTNRGERKAQPLWWSEECDKLVMERRKFLQQYLNLQTRDNLIKYKRENNRVKRELRKIKSDAFKNFCENLNFDTGLTNIWRRIKGMITRAKGGTEGVFTSQDSGKMKALQNTLVREEIPPKIFIPLMVHQPEVLSPFNNRFSEWEFETALKASNLKSSPGMDSVTYSIISKLPQKTREILLNIFNEMFMTSCYPESWRDTLIRFIPKGGGDYRPISLTSCVTKLFERMVQARLEHLSESNQWIPDFQFGFRRGRSSNSAAAVLVSDICRAFGRGESLLALALDIKGAFNSIIPQRVIQELMKVEAPPRIINFIGFLFSRRNLYFSLGGEAPRISGVGVPQGGVLSPMLFSFALKSVGDLLPDGIQIIMYADDIIIYISGLDVEQSSRLLKIAFELIESYLAELNLEISVKKTQFTIFSRIKEVKKSRYTMTLGEQTLVASKTLKYLGITLDQGLRWHDQINENFCKAKRALNVVKTLTGIRWGPSSTSLLLVSRALIVSILNWGVEFIIGAAKTHLEALDRVCYAAIRMSLGCMDSTPLSILLSEAGMAHPAIIRTELAELNILRCAQWKNNLMHRKLKDLAQDIPNFPRKVPQNASGIIKTYKSIEGLEMMMDSTVLPSYYDLTWNQLMMGGIAELNVGRELKIVDDAQSHLDKYIDEHFPQATLIFTDASFNPTSNRAALSFFALNNNHRFGIRTSEFHSIENLELLAISYAIEHSIRYQLKNVVILSDSRRAVEQFLNPILGNKKVSPLIQDMVRKIEAYLNLSLGPIKLLWVPSHRGIKGNEIADEISRNAAALPLIKNIDLSYMDVKAMVKRDMRHWGDVCWPFFPRGESTNIYYDYINVKSPRPWFAGVQINRRITTLITRIRTGHILTYDHLVERGWLDSLGCDCGYEQKTLRHLLLVCPHFSKGREQILSFLSSIDSSTTDVAVNLKIAALLLKPGTVSKFQKFFHQNTTTI